jgi:hypothetical protein
MMASVSGRRSVTVSSGARAAGDLDGSAQRLHAAPHHVHADAPAGYVGDLRAVEKPGARISEKIRLGELRPARRSALVRWRARAPPHIQAASVVAHADQTWAPECAPKAEWWRWEVCPPRGALGRLDAVIHAVADQMHQRIVQLIDHGLVQFRVGPLDRQLDFFVQIDAEIVNQPAEALEGAAQGSIRMLIEFRATPRSAGRPPPIRPGCRDRPGGPRSRSGAPAPSPVRPPD